MADAVISTTRQNIIDTCLITLGYPVVSLFVTEAQIGKLIDFAVRRCTSKACPMNTISVYAPTGVVDVSGYDIDTIHNVFSGNLDGSSCGNSDGCSICEQLCTYRSYSEMTKGDWNNPSYDRLAYQYAKSEMKKQNLYDWYLDKDLLYLDNYTGALTIEFIKKSLVLEDLDNFWTAWVENYSLAMVKITEGRIRSKYKLSSGVFDIESDNLVSEGTSEKQDLDERLNEYIGYWNIMR